jgi:hypothetical protein
MGSEPPDAAGSDWLRSNARGALGALNFGGRVMTRRKEAPR